MSVLVVGLSHKSAPVSVLERAAVSGDTLGKIAKKMLGKETAWQLIYQRNKADIPDVARLKVGATLHIPAPDDRTTTRAKRHPEPPRKLTMALRAR